MQPFHRRSSASLVRGMRVSRGGGSGEIPVFGLMKTSPSASSDSNPSSDETEAHELKTVWKLRPAPSVHDEALVVPIIRYQRRGEHAKKDFLVHLCSTYVVLAVNAVLQVMVTSKVSVLTWQQRREMSSKLWSLCKERDPATMPFSRAWDEEHSEGPQSLYYSCGPLTVTMMSKMQNVDANGDGLFTPEEAMTLKKKWTGMYAKTATLDEVWAQFAKIFKEEGDRPHSAGNVTALPMAWMKGWQDENDLCLVTDSNLCGNLEARGILWRKFPGDRDASPSRRISRCEDIVERRCPHIFGQLHRLYSRWSGELCGGKSTSWLASKNIMTIDYSKVLKYVKDEDSIVTGHYLCFLVVILLIWVMCMLEEIRTIMDWWMVLCFFPTQPGEDGAWAVEAETSIRVLAMPWFLKMMAVLLNLLPRTIICFLLCRVGSVFLIRADDYGDLIENGVALGFLVEIGSMLFAAVSRQESKDLVNACEPLTLEVGHNPSRSMPVLRSLPVAALYTMLILAITVGMIYREYTKDGGKYATGVALRCLCHASGKNCVAAQILGGFESVSAATGNEVI